MRKEEKQRGRKNGGGSKGRKKWLRTGKNGERNVVKKLIKATKGKKERI